MDLALALGRRGAGVSAENPAVGCVLVKDGRVVGRGWTQPGGRPHAETEALARAGTGARGATAYATLEPCAHHGRTPPCTDALIEAGVARVIVATVDPDERVIGNGLAALQGGGIDVVTGLFEARAADDLAGYISRQRTGRPSFSLKIATSMDGRIATARGHSKWITGPAARHAGHGLRATHDAILVGIETALADDPSLTCRLPGVAKAMVRIVLDTRGRLPVASKLVGEAPDHPLWIVAAKDAAIPAGKSPGVSVINVAREETGRLSLSGLADALGARGLNSVLVEGGGQVAAGFLKARLIDRLYWFRAGMVLGGDARPAIADLDLDRLSDAARWTLAERSTFGDDQLEIYRRAAG